MNTDDNCKDFTKNCPSRTCPLQVQEYALPECLGMSLQLPDAEPEEHRLQNGGQKLGYLLLSGNILGSCGNQEYGSVAL